MNDLVKKMSLEAGARTDRGKRRSKNEDAFYLDRQRGLFIVADGLGGHRAGNVASRLAVESMVGFFENPVEGMAPRRLLEQAVKTANRRIYDRSLQDSRLRGMGTTVVLALVRGKRIHLAHVGDSRAYLFTDEGLEQLTEDHTITYELYKQGKVSKEAIPRHPYHGVLLRSVGVEGSVEVEVQDAAFEGRKLLLCTDGLTDMVRDEQILEILRDCLEPQKACDRLVDAALENGGLDNVTVIVVGKTGEDA